MPRFSTAQKYRFCQALFAVGFLATVFCLAHLSPYASAYHNKVWFGLGALSVTLSIPFALGFYYYRSKLRSVDMGLMELQTQVQTLGKVGEQLKNTPQTQPQSDKESKNSPR